MVSSSLHICIQRGIIHKYYFYRSSHDHLCCKIKMPTYQTNITNSTSNTKPAWLIPQITHAICNNHSHEYSSYKIHKFRFDPGSVQFDTYTHQVIWLHTWLHSQSLSQTHSQSCIHSQTHSQSHPHPCPRCYT